MKHEVNREKKYPHPEKINIPFMEWMYLAHVLKNKDHDKVAQIVQTYCQFLIETFNLEVAATNFSEFTSNVLLLHSESEILDYYPGEQLELLEEFSFHTDNPKNKIIIVRIKSNGQEKIVPFIVIQSTVLPNPQQELKRLSFSLAQYAMNYSPYSLSESGQVRENILLLSSVFFIFATISPTALELLTRSHHEINILMYILVIISSSISLSHVIFHYKLDEYKTILTQRIQVERGTRKKHDSEE